MLVSFKTSKNPKEIPQLKMLCLKKQKNRGVRISKKSVNNVILMMEFTQFLIKRRWSLLLKGILTIDPRFHDDNIVLSVLCDLSIESFPISE